jgi:thiol-disulfide isomerase/thioredoxin
MSKALWILGLPALFILPAGEEEEGANDGRELVGKPFIGLEGARWLDGTPAAFKDAKLTLVRWWTDGCPHCEASLPALDELRKRHDRADLRLVGVYHPKPRRRVTDPEVREALEALKVECPVIIDPDWELLEKAWLGTGKRQATSVTFLVDSKGIIRFVHPGPRIHRSDDPEEKEADNGMKRLEAAIEELLKEK